MANNKRKRVVLTLEDKLEVIKLREEGNSIDRIATQFNIGGSTVSEIYKRKTEIESAVEKNKKTGKVRKTMKEGKNPELENELYDWFLEQRENGSSPSSPEIIEKAKQIHSQLNQEIEFDWNPTKGWVIRFKERYGIKPDTKPLEQPNTTAWHSALDAAEYLLDYVNSRDYLLKDVITVRMIRDRIASEEQECQTSDY